MKKKLIKDDGMGLKSKPKKKKKSSDKKEMSLVSEKRIKEYGKKKKK